MSKLGTKVLIYRLHAVLFLATRGSFFLQPTARWQTRRPAQTCQRHLPGFQPPLPRRPRAEREAPTSLPQRNWQQRAGGGGKGQARRGLAARRAAEAGAALAPTFPSPTQGAEMVFPIPSPKYRHRPRGPTKRQGAAATTPLPGPEAAPPSGPGAPRPPGPGLTSSFSPPELGSG